MRFVGRCCPDISCRQKESLIDAKLHVFPWNLGDPGLDGTKQHLDEIVEESILWLSV